VGDWQLIDGKTSETGEGQLIVKRSDDALEIGPIVARVYEDTPAFGEWTPTARLLAAAPNLARLTADLAALALKLGDALADHHAGTSTTRPYRQTFERDAELLGRTRALVTKAKERLEDLTD